MPSPAHFDPQPVTLQGDIVRLEPLRLDHAPGLLSEGADESIWRYLGTAGPSNLAEAKQWIEGRLADQAAGTRLPVAVICLADEKFAGATGYAAINRPYRTTEIGSWYGVDYQRTGVNTESTPSKHWELCASA